MSTEKSWRTTPTLKLVLVEVGRDPSMTAATWEITPDIDKFVGDYNKAITYARERAKRDRADWDAENDRIFKKGLRRDWSSRSS